MQDPSTTSPSDPENPDSGNEPGQQPKKPLKLKPIGQPATEQAKPKEESDLDKKRQALKLRRMVIKDVEIKPHANPDAEPVPEAQPFEEPDEAPPPADLKSVMEGPPPEETAIQPPKVETRPTGSGELPPEAPPRTEPPETSQPPKPVPAPPKQKDTTKKAKVSSARKLIAGLAFLGVFCLAAMLAIAYFNPFGKDLAPIQPQQLPIVPQQAESTENEGPQAALPDFENLAADSGQQDLQTYLERLQGFRITPSSSPRGIFIESVFVPEGAVLDPRLGLTLTAVTMDNGDNSILLTPSEGTPVSILIGN
jgi:hypothetical protein